MSFTHSEAVLHTKNICQDAHLYLPEYVWNSLTVAQLENIADNAAHKIDCAFQESLQDAEDFTLDLLGI